MISVSSPDVTGASNSALSRGISASARPTDSCGRRSVKSYHGSKSTHSPRSCAVRSPCLTAR